jgi:hypothetical protein
MMMIYNRLRRIGWCLLGVSRTHIHERDWWGIRGFFLQPKTDAPFSAANHTKTANFTAGPLANIDLGGAVDQEMKSSAAASSAIDHHDDEIHARVAALPKLAAICTPCQHFSGRTLVDNNDTLWASWSLVGPTQRVFFGGDTGLRHVPVRFEFYVDISSV